MAVNVWRNAALTAAALVAVVAGACDTPVMTESAPAYDPLLPAGSAKVVYHWEAGHEISIYVDPTAEPAGVDLAAAVRAAIAAWEPVGRLGEVSLRIVDDIHDADVIFHHSGAPRLVTGEGCVPFDFGSGGFTFFCIDDDLEPVPLLLNDGSGGHVQMDVSINSFALDTVSFFPALVIHEMGHVLGIGSHSPTPTDLMYGRPRLFAPSAADAATLRYVLSRRPDVQF